MGRLKDIFKGPHRVFAWFVVVTTTIFILLWIIGPGNTIGHWIRASREDARDREDSLALRAKITELDRQIELMEGNIDTLEKFAREQYYFAGPGEDVYVVE